MDNKLKGLKLEFHILQSFPVSCLNRDDIGSPKSAVIGGVLRARVSSQCWKRQVRMRLNEMGLKLAVRTRYMDEMIAKECLKFGASEEQAKICGQIIASGLSKKEKEDKKEKTEEKGDKKDQLLFFTEKEAAAFAEYAKNVGFDLADPSAKKETDKYKKAMNEIYKIAKRELNPALDGADIALFGRMVAQAAELNVNAAASFAHAISTHEAKNETDFFTALDDLKKEDETGSGHMGSLEYNSATYYRYVSLDLGQLYENLHGDNIVSVLDAFIKALYIAVPEARQTSMAGFSPWDYARIELRKGQNIQASFEKPILSGPDGGYLEASITALNDYLNTKEKQAGSLYGKIGEYVLSEEKSASIDDIAGAIKKDVEDALK